IPSSRPTPASTPGLYAAVAAQPPPDATPSPSGRGRCPATLCAVSGVLLAVDIGNTNVKLGTFEGEELTATWRLETDAVRMPDEYAALLDWLLHRRGIAFEDVDGVSLSSTVPAMVPIFRELVANYLRPSCGLVEGLVARIKKQLGPDTLVIATGGLADFVLSETDVVDVHDPTLTLKGLRLYYERNVTCNSR